MYESPDRVVLIGRGFVFWEQLGVLGQLAERAEPTVDDRGVDADAVVCATRLEAPGAQRRNSQCAHLCTPGCEKGRGRRAESHLDPPAGATAGGDRGIRVGHELGNDLHQSTPPWAKFSRK
jgi:hypothetical protein